VLPEPTANPVEYFAAAFGFPAWLAARLTARHSWNECLRLGFWFAGPAPLWLRCNPLRASRETCLAALAQGGIGATAGTHPQAIRVDEPAAIRELPGFALGWFTVQDESAMAVGSALAPVPGAKVLDLCAAPGGKTTHLAELMHNQGEIFACDVDAERLRRVDEQCRRLGIDMVRPRLLRPEKNEDPPSGPFDAILVDVPCSNTGVLGRRPEARWRLRPDVFERLVPLQTKLLIQAAERMRPGGTVVYSTCSVEPEENQSVVRTVLGANPGLAIEAEEEHVPGHPSDGGYWARLRHG
jgi:16S rRNA (cytosine967-C5)-methyltransferase